MKEAVLGTPIFWVNTKKAAIQLDFDIQPIRAKAGEALLDYMLSSSLIQNKSVEMIVVDDVVKSIRYKLNLTNFELDYVDHFIERLEKNIEILFEQFVINSGGYHYVQV